jgi:AraC-like DNA-binding protein
MSGKMANNAEHGSENNALFGIEELALEVNTRVNNQQSTHGRFIFIQRGVIAIITEQGRHLVPPEQAIWLPHSIGYQIVAATSAEIICYSLHQATRYDLSNKTTVLAVDDFLKKMINESITEQVMSFGEPAFYHLSHLLLNRLKLAIPLSLFLPALKDERLMAITSRQQKFPALKTDLNAWGKFVHASPRTLSRLFKNETGMTYSQWKQIMLIHIAIIQLSLGQSITVIAKNLGYESSSAFIYMFKKHMHVTPSHYLTN